MRSTSSWLFRLTHLENTGAAFSLFAGLQLTLQDRSADRFFRGCSGRGFGSAMERPRRLSLGYSGSLSILGGAIGNLWDRLSDGKVTDFLDFYIGAHTGRLSTYADSAIVVVLCSFFCACFAKNSAHNRSLNCREFHVLQLSPKQRLFRELACSCCQTTHRPAGATPKTIMITGKYSTS